MATVMITGGTGLIGKNLTRHLLAKEYDVIILSRNPGRLSDNPMVTFSLWNTDEQKIDSKAIAHTDYIINLAGAGVMEKKWTKKYKKIITDSRIKSSELLIKGLQENPNHVKTIVSASAIGWYGKDTENGISRKKFTEIDPSSTDYLGETCKLWEASINPVTQLNKRLVKLRTGIVLSNDGGALSEFKKPLRLGIAAVLAGGKQIISWIHMDDLCRMYIYAMENEQLSGCYNAVAPSPLSHKDLILNLAKKMRGQFYIPIHVPGFLLKLVLGERSIEILKSSTVSCEKIKKEGFIFLYPTIDAALKELGDTKP